MIDQIAIAARVATVIEEIADTYPHLVTRDLHLQSDLGLDSFERVELLNALEDEFAVSFVHPQDRELSRPQATVADIVAAVTNLLAMKASI